MTTHAETIRAQLEAEQAAIAAMIDTTEQALAQSVLKWKLASHKGEKGAAAELARASRELEAYRSKRPAGDGAAADSDEYFAKPAQALPWLQRGYIINKSKFYKDVADGKVPRKNGVFRAADLLYYARAAGLTPASTPEKTTSADGLTAAKEQIAQETARKIKMENDRKEGTLILRSLAEQEISSRLAFLKRDLYNLGPRAIDTMVEKFCILVKEHGVDIDGVNLHSLIADMEQYWDKNITAYLDSYARPRGFLPPVIGGTTE